ncbi:MAG: hypothetical protein MUO31_07705 [Thermodesulfovibrionales bacterium]|nr:hypothetical protein [Thermodesulfovibrionales bacterium]
MDSIESVADYSRDNFGFMCAFLNLRWNPTDWTLFVRYAVENKEKDALTYYLMNHASINFYISETLAEIGELWALKLVLKRFGRLPYHVSKYAARNGHVECLRFLLDAVYVDPSGTGAMTNGNYMEFRHKFPMPCITYAERCDIINYGNRHSAASVAVKCGYLDCFKICHVYTAELAVAAIQRGFDNIFRDIFREIEKTHAELTSIAKTLTSDLDCLRIFYDVMGSTHYSWAYVKRSTLLIDDSDSVEYMAELGVIFTERDCLSAIRFNAKDSLAVMIAYINPPHKELLAYALRAAHLNHFECIITMEIFNNAVAIATIDNQRWFKRIISHYDPYHTSADDACVEQLERLVCKDLYLLEIWHQSTGRFPSDAARDACTENDIDRLSYILDNSGVIAMSAFEHAAFVGAAECLALLLAHHSATSTHRLKCANISAKNGHLACVKVCGVYNDVVANHAVGNLSALDYITQQYDSNWMNVMF